MSELYVTNGKVIAPDGIRDGAGVLVSDGRISRIDVPAAPGSPGRRRGKLGSCANVLDAGGLFVSPGFIDVHIQGAGGADVLNNSRDSLATIAKTAARFGTTTWLATTVYRPGGDNRHLKTAAELVGDKLDGAELLGVHLEGPFVNPEKKGMIKPDSICAPSREVLDDILDSLHGTLRMMTIAPELDGALDFVHTLLDADAVASFGHSAATYEETLAGFHAGISHVTHLFNAMPSIHHRSPGPLPAIFETEDITTQVICDGVHIHAPILKMVCDFLGPGRLVAITDGMQPMGLADGKYIYNGIEYEAKNGTARYMDGTLIGTAFGLNRLVGKLKEFSGFTFEEAIATATANPARTLGIYDRKGSIEVGKDGDLVILGEDFSVRATIVGGDVVFGEELTG